jgi:hypothetical protein
VNICDAVLLNQRVDAGTLGFKVLQVIKSLFTLDEGWTTLDCHEPSRISLARWLTENNTSDRQAR